MIVAAKFWHLIEEIAVVVIVLLMALETLLSIRGGSGAPTGSSAAPILTMHSQIRNT